MLYPYTNAGLLNELWEASFTAQQIKGGFRGTGLFPLSRAAIHPSKLAPATAFHQQPATVQSPVSTSQSVGACASATIAGSTDTTMQLSCSKCGGSMTPVRLHVVAYFSRHLEGKRPAPRDQRRVKPQFYGEALTGDEVFVRLEKAEQERAQKIQEKEEKQKERKKLAQEKKEKQKERKEQREKERRAKEQKKAEREAEVQMAACASGGTDDDNDHAECEVCGGTYEDDSEEKKKAWIGCDRTGCDRWFHYWCVGFKRKPSTRCKFLCYVCKPQ